MAICSDDVSLKTVGVQFSDKALLRTVSFQYNYS